MDWESLLYTGLRWSFILCFTYLMVLYAFMLVMLGFAVLENRLRTHEGHAEDYDVLVTSRFTIPVSVIAPAYNEEVVIVPAVRSLLAFDYPEFEVVVVNDGSTDGMLELLRRTFDLEPCEFFYRRRLPSKDVYAVYRGSSEPRLTVVHKANGGKADALNCGVNLAKYRYVCCVDSDAVYSQDALLKGMRLVVKDPAVVLGVTSLIGISRYPELNGGFENGSETVDRRLLSNFDNLDLLRSFINSRLAWSRLHFMLCCSGAFMIWRRDLVQEMGGFSKDFSCEDIEITFRVNERFLRERRRYTVLSLPDPVAMTEGPDTISRLVSQRERWQRVILETAWHYRRLFANPRYRSVGLIGVPYYVFGESLGPFFQALAVLTLIVGASFRLLSWTQFLSVLGIMAFGVGILTSAAILLHDTNFRYYRFRDFVRLVLLGPLDIVFFRPVLFYAQFKGLWGFLRGDKGWYKFERNSRGLKAAPL